MKPDVNYDKCMHCGACVGTCPVNAIFLKETILEISDDCTECRLCVNICPVQALEMR
ncbi:MAG: 4Fe-4S binding protein [Thermoplasmata archaeon]